MRMRQMAEELNLICLTPDLPGDPEIMTGYVSDVLSDIVVHARDGGVLVTFQVHMYAVAVAVQAAFSAVVFSLGRRPEPAVITRAIQHGIHLFCAEDLSFDIVGHLYAVGIRGRRVSRK